MRGPGWRQNRDECDRVGKTKRGKGSKLMVLTDGEGIPLAVDVESAGVAEVRLIDPLIDPTAPHSASGSPGGASS